jgi:hypothetical protein
MKSSFLAVSMLCASIGTVAATESAVHAAGGTISGVVTDTSGNPIVGATVQAAWDWFGGVAPPVTTDEFGAYTMMLDARPQPWRVASSAPGYAAQYSDGGDDFTAQGFLIADAETYVVDITLQRKTASVTGVILDHDGTPLQGATVYLWANQSPPSFMTDPSDSSRSFVTGADGAYEFTQVRPVPHRVVVYPPSPRTDLIQHGITEADEVLLTEDQTVARDVTMQRGSSISGRVTDPAGLPVAGASVSVNQFPEVTPVVTAIDGSYVVRGVAAGEVFLGVAPPEGGELLSTWYGDVSAISAATSITVPPSTDLVGYDVRMRQGTTLNVDLVGARTPFVSVIGCTAPATPVFQTFGGSCSDPTTGSFWVTPGSDVIPAGQWNVAASASDPTTGTTSSEVVSFDALLGVPTNCVFVMGGPGSTCEPGDPATNDGDGVSPTVEDGVAPSGDGNGDGIRDAVQGSVASLSSASGEYVSVVVPNDVQLRGTKINSSGGDAVFGQIETKVSVAVGGTVEVRLTKATPWRLNRLYDFYWPGREPLPESLYSVDGNSIVVRLTDGQRGDFTFDDLPIADGSIRVMLTPVFVDEVPPTITCPANAPEFQQYSAGSLTYTVVDRDSGMRVFGPDPTVPTSTVTTDPVTRQWSVSTAVPGPAVALVQEGDVAGNLATAGCPYTVYADDNDGVPAFIENLAPNDGDGNGDGIRDSRQSDVASNASLTLVAPTPTRFTSFDQFASSALLPGGATFDGNPISATLADVPTGDVALRLIRHDGVWSANTFYASQPFGWTRLPSAYAGNEVTVTIRDGGAGDGDGTANGSLSLYGGPAVGDVTPPTIECVAVTFPQGRIGAVVRANISDSGSGVFVSSILTPVDTTLQGTFAVEVRATDVLGNEAVQMCDYTVGDDGDGVPAAVENAHPSNGDGNGDAVLDSAQPTIASLAVPTLGYASISANGFELTGVSVSSLDGSPRPSPRYQLEAARYRVTIQAPYLYGLSISRTWSSDARDLLVLADGAWQRYGGASDGSGYDLDGPGNGTITLEVAFATEDFTPPTVECPVESTFLLNQPNGQISANVSDAQSGVETTSVSVPVNTSVLGYQVAYASATDRAGNVGVGYCFYSVGVELQRLNAPDPSVNTVVKAGKVLAVRWRAVDYFGVGVSDASHFLGVDFTDATCKNGKTDYIEPVRDRGLRYLGNGRWQFDVATPATKGCYTMTLQLTGDQATARVRTK